MKSDFLVYLGGAGMLIFIYFVFRDPSGTTRIINSLSGANTNAILALQGRTPSGVL